MPAISQTPGGCASPCTCGGFPCSPCNFPSALTATLDQWNLCGGGPALIYPAGTFPLVYSATPVIIATYPSNETIPGPCFYYDIPLPSGPSQYTQSPFAYCSGIYGVWLGTYLLRSYLYESAWVWSTGGGAGGFYWGSPSFDVSYTCPPFHWHCTETIWDPTCMSHTVTWNGYWDASEPDAARAARLLAEFPPDHQMGRPCGGCPDR